MAGFRFDIDVDSSRFKRGSDDMADAVDELVDGLVDLERDGARSLDDVADAARDAGRDLERGLGESVDDVADEADRLEKKYRDAFDTVGDSSRKAGRKLKDDVGEGTRAAAVDFDELAKNADSNAQEMASSFDGSLESITEFATEMLAETSEAMGLAWAPVGILAAAGLSLAVANLQKIADKTNEVKEQAAELALEYRDATETERVELLRDRWDELATKIADARSWFEVWQDDAVTTIEQIAASTRGAGDEVAAFMDAFNEPDAIARQRELERALELVRGELDPLADAHARQAAASLMSDSATRDLTDAERDRRAALGDLVPLIEDELELQRQQNDVTEALARAEGLTTDAYLERQKAQARATEAQESYLGALEATADAVDVHETILERKNDAERAAAEATAAATADAGDSWEDYVDEVEVSTGDLIKEWNRQAKEAEAFESNLAKIAAAGGDALADELRAKGPEVAGSVASVIAKSSPAQQRRAIEAHARATGREVSGTIASGITDRGGQVDNAVARVLAGVKPSPVRVEVVPYAERGAWQRQLQTLVGGVTVSANVAAKRLGQAAV